MNSRAFWIAITAWSAKVPSSSISLSENGRGGWRMTAIEPMPRPSHSIGAQSTEKLPIKSITPRSDSRCIGNDAASGRCSARRSAITRPVIVCSSGLGNVRTHRVQRRTAPRRGMHLAVVPDEEDAELLDREKMLAAVEDLVEHRRRVGHGAADDLQHVGSGGLLLERLLGFVEKARVLDRDHRLVGEGLQQAAFLGREGPHVDSARH